VSGVLNEQGDPPAKLHIGKSSAGWVFALHVYPEHDLITLGDWLNRWEEGIGEEGQIQTEFGTTVSLNVMLEQITRRRWDKARLPEWWEANDAEAGPNGLARRRRARPAPPGCTWEYLEEDFS
jgi:hypothetical protein